MSDGGNWINVESDATDAPPEIVAGVLEAAASTIRNAPDGRSYDFELVVRENHDAEMREAAEEGMKRFIDGAGDDDD